MPQFAIYRNPGRNRDIPFVVQIQSNRLERSVGRVVMPLVRRSGRAPPDHPLTPHLHVEEEDVFANPLELATVPATRLGAAFGSSVNTIRARSSGLWANWPAGRKRRGPSVVVVIFSTRTASPANQSLTYSANRL